MTELIQQAGDILAQSKELLKLPLVKETITGFISWMGKKIFSNKKTAKEKLALIEQQKADAETIASLKSNLEYALDGNEKLQQQLAEKMNEIENLLNKAGVHITDNSITQTHNGKGDNVGGDKIIGK